MNDAVLPALQIQGVSKSFGSVRAVRNVSFSVPRTVRAKLHSSTR